MDKVLKPAFFARPAPVVARALLGKFLVLAKKGRPIAKMITETEAYHGPDDEASHASRGRTPRNVVMFGPAGVWYVYLVYGMHEMLNIVTGRAGHPSAVLIRSLAGRPGPGRLTKFLKINRRFNGRPASQKVGLYIIDRGIKIPNADIKRGPRIGVAYASPKWRQKPWRFFVKNDIEIV